MTIKNHKLKVADRGNVVTIANIDFHIDKIKVSHSSVINKILTQIKIKVTDLSAGICSPENVGVDTQVEAFVMLITENMQFKQSVLALLADLTQNEAVATLSLQDLLILINEVIKVNKEELTKKIQEMPSLVMALLVGQKAS
jgi:hypothetical protein